MNVRSLMRILPMTITGPASTAGAEYRSPASIDPELLTDPVIVSAVIAGPNESAAISEKCCQPLGGIVRVAGAIAAEAGTASTVTWTVAVAVEPCSLVTT